MLIYDDERVDYVNDSLSLIQKPDGLTFGTDALLLAGYVSSKFDRGVEFGTGSGIISMLLLTRNKIKNVTAYELQEEYCSLAKRNAEYNSLDDRLFIELSDIRAIKPNSTADIVFTNPPYMRCDSGKNNCSEKKSFARHELNGDISDFCLAAKKILKYGGSFYLVYRPDRLADLIFALRQNKLEPKRMTFVHADVESESSMVLVEARSGGKSGLYLTPPLIIYKDNAHKEYSEDMNYIMENGSFPKEYKR